MRKIHHILVAAILVIGSATAVFAKENIGGPQRKSHPGDGFAAGCAKSTNAVNIDLNNVRAPIQMNGDMWWDLVNDIARYEIPKGSGKTSLFAGAIWIGGRDNSGNLKIAAQTYRQSGVDFWPGPLDTVSVSTDPNECLAYDRHWKLLRSDVQTFANIKNGTQQEPKGYAVPADIKSWPGNGDASRNEGHFLAPFNESIKLQKIAAGETNLVQDIGKYKWEDGDYPDFDLSAHPTCGHLYGDQNIWWVFNDEGNIHTETGGAPIGLEIRAQAFCFQTNDEINNCTFYNYQIINRSSATVNDTWFGAWVDPDLGYGFDDYVGCDVGRGLGYVYNGEAFDPGTFGYGFNPPAAGLDFFQGPIADANDGIDNNRDGNIDEPGEEIIMSQFVYYTNDFSVIGNPLTATNYYNYLKGIWIDGTPITYGATGHGGTTPCNFMFPGDTDPRNWGTNLGKTLQSGGVEAQIQGPTPPGVPGGTWTESTAGDLPGDRRFLQSAGKFTLQPGAVNYITTGAVWARTTSGGPIASVALLQLADDKAQALFNNCFAITNGPDAPNMTIRELNQELILSVAPGKFSNDSIEINYIEKDPFILKSTDTAYHFQGYQLYQFADNSVSITDIGNLDKARLVAQCDIKDNVAQIVNQVFNPSINAFVATDEVDGANVGLQHTFDITTDAFATGTSTSLINHQTYYFTVIAYAYNSSEVSFDPYHPADGHSTPYISGRRNVFTYTAIPHIPDPQDGGLLLNSSYGASPMVQRLEGTGNGGIVLDMTQASIDSVLNSASNRVIEPIYESGHGPINVQIYDPVAVGNHDFLVYLANTTVNSKWYITEIASGTTDSSDQTIVGNSEKLFPQWGIKVNIQQLTVMAGDSATNPAYASPNNGFLEGTMTFSDNNKQWLSGVSDVDRSPQNWILAGTDTITGSLLPPIDYYPFEDPNQVYEKVINGTWAPFRLTSSDVNGPMYSSSLFSRGLVPKLDSLFSIDVVITSDKSKWSRSVVIEEQADTLLAQGGAAKGSPRKHLSVDKNGLTVAQGGTSNPSDPNASDYVSPTGMGWFPGYAINIESGERLNIMFGEDSYLQADNGNDMLFNPSANTYSQFFDPLFGGKHYIYVMGRGVHNGNKTDTNSIYVAYDACNLLKYRLDSAVNISPVYNNPNKKTIKTNAWKDCRWVGFPLLVEGHSMLESDVKIRLRVAKAYQNYNVGNLFSQLDPSGLGIPYYKFSTTGLEAETNQTPVATTALDLINIVPNPYYSYSAYEKNQLDNRVKIVNLPNNCTVSIFTSSGTLVRRFIRSIPASIDLSAGAVSQSVNNSSISSETTIDWDLKNGVGVPVSGGVYIIHIKADGLGEKVIKWFGVIRPIDLDTF